MYTTPTLIQSACSYGDATTWHLDQVHLFIFNILHFTLSVGGKEVPYNLTQVVYDTLGGTSTSGETITTFYESAQLDSGEPNTLGFSNTLSNSIPCISNYPFVIGNHFTKKERDQVTNLLIKYENVFALSMKDLSRCKTMQLFIDLTYETPIYRRKHRLSKHEWELVDERCKELHEASLIQPSSFDLTIAIIMPTKFPILKRLDFSKVFILHTNWSAFGIGVIFNQLDEEGKEYVIAYASQSNNKADSNYSLYKGECLDSCSCMGHLTFQALSLWH
jgi:hypothetical protein